MVTNVVEVLTMSDTLTATVHAADQYRKMAADCREQSERAPNSHHKENWLKLPDNGKTWLRRRKRTANQEGHRDGWKAARP